MIWISYGLQLNSSGTVVNILGLDFPSGQSGRWICDVAVAH